MKTILSLSAVLATIAALGLIPLALADSKEMKETALPGASEQASSPSKTPSSTKENPEAEKPRAVAESPAKTSPKPKTKTTVSTASKRSPGSAKTEEPSLTPTQEDKLLMLLNEGTVEDLDAIPGIAATRADSIVSARPYASINEIILVEGVGNATFEKILAHGKTLTQRTTVAANETRKS
jgi:DNA uptake protein ComE-like DNA-binding protein